MKIRVGPLRWATWGYSIRRGARGFAISWIGQRFMASWEFHWERFR